jgi:AraC family transcriptional regulator
MIQNSAGEDRTDIILGPPYHRHWCGAAGYSIKTYVGGRVLFRIERHLCSVGDDASVLVNAGQEYEFRTPADSGLFNFTIFMSRSDVEDCWASLMRSELALLDDPMNKGAGIPEFFVTRLRPTTAEQKLRRDLRELAEAGALTTEARAVGTAELIASALRAQWLAMGQARRVEAVRRSTREETARRLRRAIDAIEADVAKPLDLEGLAVIACMSKYHFLRRFKSITGETPHQFMLERRVARGRELLLTSDLSAAEIGQQCGFTDPSSFSAAFRGRHGLPPQAWRSLQRRKRVLSL